MVLSIAITNPNIVAERSEMLRACMLYDNPEQICLSNETIQFLSNMCQDNETTLDVEKMEQYVSVFVVALERCNENDEKSIGAMMNSYIASTLAIYFCCSDKVISSCISYLAKDTSQFFKRQFIFNELVENNQDQLWKQIDNFRSTSKKNKKHFTKQQSRPRIPDWENKFGPVLKPGESLIL